MLPWSTQPSPEEDSIKMFLKRLQRSNGGRSKRLHRENTSKKPAECKHTTDTNTHTLSCSTSVGSSVKPGHTLSFLIYCWLRQPFLCLFICCVIIFTPTATIRRNSPTLKSAWGPWSVGAALCSSWNFNPVISLKRWAEMASLMIITGS